MPACPNGPQEPLPLADDSAIKAYTETIVRLTGEYEFNSYTIGTRLRIDLPDADAAEVKRNLNLRLALAVWARLPECDPKPIDSDITFIVTYPGTRVEALPSAIFIYGRYLKHTRNLPQARWLCPKCQGRGCKTCGGSGRVYTNSVQEIIAAPLLAALRARASKMHATGRQDVDVRMLGNGRPFVLEMLNPHRRSADFAAVEQQVNAGGSVEVRGLRPVSREIVKRVDTARADKSYHAVVKCERAIEESELAGLLAAPEFTVQQQTPQRVVRRRADIIRVRKLVLLSARAPASDPDRRRFELDLRAQSGTYIKEFISGDAGRTHPSISELVGSQCLCETLDVTDVHFDPFDEPPV